MDKNDLPSAAGKFAGKLTTAILRQLAGLWEYLLIIVAVILVVAALKHLGAI